MRVEKLDDGKLIVFLNNLYLKKNSFSLKNNLEKYFKRYSRKERDKVKHISIDFYSGYISLAEKLFKNADISIDRFHIIIQVYNALNNARIKLCYKNNPNRIFRYNQ